MPASCNHQWSIFKAWKDWKVACVSFADSDVCSEYELKRRAHYLGIPVAQLRVRGQVGDGDRERF